MTRLLSSTLLALAIPLTVMSIGLVPPTTHVLPRDLPQITAKPISRPDLINRDLGKWVEVCPTSGDVTGCDYIAIHDVIAEPNGGHYVPVCDSNNDCQYIGYIEPTVSIAGSTSYQLHTSEGLEYIVPVAAGLLLGEPVPPPGPAPGPDTPDAPEDSALPSPTAKSSTPLAASSKFPTAKSTTPLAASSVISTAKSSTPLPASSWITTAKSSTLAASSVISTAKSSSKTTAITSSQSLESTRGCFETATTTESISLNDDWFVSEIAEWGTMIDWIVGWVGMVTAVPPATTATPSAISATITPVPTKASSSPTPAWSTCYSSADLSVRVFGDFVSATAKASASAYWTGIANLKPAQPPHQGWPGGCTVPNPGGLPAMPDSELNFNVNKDTGGFCAGVSYTTAAFNLDDCLAAYNAILSDCSPANIMYGGRRSINCMIYGITAAAYNSGPCVYLNTPFCSRGWGRCGTPRGYGRAHAGAW